MKKIRWGILSTAKIGVKQVIPAMQKGQYSEVAAISSRSLEKAQTVASQLNITKAYGSYEELLEDGDIDAIYNPLPNHLHCEWTIKAMEAGKHVLCEKPLGLTAEEIEQMIEVRNRSGVKAGEAFMVKSNHQWQLARELVQKGEIGDLRMIQAMFSYYNVDPVNIRNKVDTGGGAIWDIGCYPVTISRYLFGREPIRVAALLENDPAMKTDRLGSVILEFESGQANFGVSTQLVPFQRVHLFGTKGHIELPIPFNAPNDRPCNLLQDSGNILQDEITTHTLKTVDQYTLQGDDFSKAILEDRQPPSTFEDALHNTRAILAIFHAAKSGRWVEL